VQARELPCFFLRLGMLIVLLACTLPARGARTYTTVWVGCCNAPNPLAGAGWIGACHLIGTVIVSLWALYSLCG
jgi:hypothetical protein